MLHTKVSNFIIFQIAWFCAIYMHNTTGAVMCLALGLLNFMPIDSKYLQRLALGIAVSLIGIANDYLLYHFKILSFSNSTAIFIPFWLPALWLAFSSTLHSSLVWMQKMRLIPMALLSAIGGSISYVGGAKLGAIDYNLTNIPALVFHFINWFILLPIILCVYSKLMSKLSTH